MKGEVVYLYAFDVANEIVTQRVHEVLSTKPFPFEIRQERTLPKDMPMYRPLAIEPTPLAVPMLGQPVRWLVRIYDIGVVTVAMRVRFDVRRLSDLMPYHDPTIEGEITRDQLAQDLCEQVCKSLKEFMSGQSEFPVTPEAYTVFCLTDIEGVTDVTSWLAHESREVAGLLSETDAEQLSEAQVNEVLRVQRSFQKEDMVVIDWDAALVVDLTDYVDDVLYVLELANLQLEEFRVMDQRLDRYLDQAYDDVSRSSRFPLFVAADVTLRNLRQFRVDLSRLHDEVTNITKFFGDWYLARVYLGARERFHLDQWRNSVEQRLAQLDQLYNVVHSEINERRMLWLEALIVVFFAIDLIGLFVMKR